MIGERWQLFLLGWAVAAALQALLYVRQRRTPDATPVDAGWAVSLALLAVLYAVLAPGAVEHRVLVALLVSIESLRIAWTGIPPSEQQALRSRGEEYRRYPRETSPFVPLQPGSTT